MNCVAAVLVLPAASAKISAAISMVVAPSAEGVKTPVKTELLVAEKLLKDPPDNVKDPDVKLVMASLLVKVSVKVPSLVVAPSATAVLPLAAVMIMVGFVVSKVQLNLVAAVLLLPAASVKVLAAISMVIAPSAVGVKTTV